MASKNKSKGNVNSDELQHVPNEPGWVGSKTEEKPKPISEHVEEHKAKPGEAIKMAPAGTKIASGDETTPPEALNPNEPEK